MRSFLYFLNEDYLVEKGPIPSLGTLAAVVGSNKGESHAKKYYSKEALAKNNKFTLWQDHAASGSKAGDELEISDIRKKDGQFHGVVKGEGGKETLIPMSSFYKPRAAGGRVGKDQEGAEQSQVSNIQDAIDAARGNSPYIRVHLGNGKWVSLAGVQRVDKDFANKQGYKGSKPKADSVFVDNNGQPVDYQSLKAEGKFQQLGGVEDHRDKDTRQLHPVVQAAVDTLAAHAKKHKMTGGVPEGLMYHTDFDEKDPETRKMIARSMYGRDFGSGSSSVTNVNRLIHGGIAFKPASIQDPEAEQHKGIPSFDLDARQFQNTGNHETSDIIPVKAVVRKSGDQNQLGTGGRIMMIPKESENYKSSIDTRDSQGPKKDRQARIKDIQARAEARAQATRQRRIDKMAQSAGATRDKPISTSEMMKRAAELENKREASNKVKGFKELSPQLERKAKATGKKKAADMRASPPNNPRVPRRQQQTDANGRAPIPGAQGVQPGTVPRMGLKNHIETMAKA